MAEEHGIQQPTAEETPQGEPEAKETDWKAEARKWEARAKKSAQAEQELEALKQAQMTEQEKATARAEAAEKELAALKAEAARHESAAKVAEAEKVPLQLLNFCKDEEEMLEFAKAYKSTLPEPEPLHAAATASGSKIVTGGESKVSTRDQFAQFVQQQLH